ncbi:MAG: glycosyl hydrolase [Chloroflexi bacterium]|nr:glycosyl hydrolase [Chloroflexota bacterium]
MRRRLVIPIGSIALLLLLGGGVLGWWLVQGQGLTVATPQAAAKSVATTGTPVYDGAEARATLIARRSVSAPDTTSSTSGLSVVATASVTATPTPIVAVTANPTGSAGTVRAATPAAVAISSSQKLQIESQLAATWASYKQRFIEPSGRVIDPTADNITTSEGQSYALLRAVWMNDRATFDKVLEWTQTNLQPDGSNKLFAYKWGRAADNSWKVLDASSASDADCDIALALVFASRRWNDLKYWKLALEVLTAVWDREVVEILGVPYLTAGDWAASKATVSLNPSYLAPYTMRIFAAIDPYHNWPGVVDSSYRVIQGCSETALAGTQAVKLPANWCGINRTTGQLTVAQDYPRLDTNYGYDAFRTMWRVALDYRWFGDSRALDYLNWSDTLRLKWKQDGKLAAIYDYSGKPVQAQEDLAVYGGNLANFLFTEPSLASDMVNSKLLAAFNKAGAADSGNLAGWGDPENYYSQNWVWFGLAFYADALPNLALVRPFAPAGAASNYLAAVPAATIEKPASRPTPLPVSSPAGTSPTPLIAGSPEVSVPANLAQHPPVTPSPAS